MSAITSTGLGSGLDINGMVTKLIAAEGQGPTALITSQTTKAKTHLSSLGVLKSALADFQASVQTMRNIPTFKAHVATSSNSTSFTATADSSAVPVNYPITVNALAQSDIKRSAAFASDTALVGSGSLAINLGSSSFNITTDSTTTLSGLRDAINQASDNPGIQASIIKVSNTDSRLVFSSTTMGAENTIGVTTALPNLANLTSIQAASDSSIYVGGGATPLLIQRPSNTISDAVSGVTISLIKPDPIGGNLSVTSDTSGALSGINNFISSYNALNSTITSLSSYDPVTKTAGPLFSDSTLSGIQNQIRQAMSKSVPGGISGFSTLVDIGITKDKTGALSLDSTKFNNAVAKNFSAMSTIFTSTNGVAVTLNNVLNNALSYNGSITSHVNSDNKKIASLVKDQAALNIKLAASQARYLAQFNAMDTIMGKFQNTSSFLNQQFYSTPKN